MFLNKINKENLPNHIAITMDGNGRWAKTKGKFRVFGHQKGVKAVRDTVEAAAEIGTIFTALVLITGPIWATPIWGTPWVWEPRLITTLVLFLIYIGYFIMRNIGLYRQRAALVCAIIGIIAFLDIPIIFASVNFWAAEIQSHPQLGMNKQPAGILNPGNII